MFFAACLLCSLNLTAQQRNADPKLEALKNEKDQAALRQKIKTLENGSAEDMELLVRYYDKNAAKKASVTKSLVKKYPESQQAQMLRLTPFLKADGAEGTEKALTAMLKDYPGINLDLEKTLVAAAYAEQPNLEKVLQYLNMLEDQVMRARAVTQVADIMAGYDNAAALKFSAGELERIKQLKAQTAPSKPMKLDPQDAYYDYINQYGKLLFNTGKNDEAYQYTTEAYQHIKNKDAELIENYAFLSSLNGKYEEALPILAKAVKEGKLEQRYVYQVRKGYAQLHPGKDVDAYIEGLQRDFKAKIRGEVVKLLINKAAPDFYVTDVNGKKVTLADFKGKTIVLDFWATWCGPCVESFPAMQMAVNRYANDPDVKFLFIHTWENVKDPLTDAKNFLSKRKYSFDLYMDPRDPSTKQSAAADAFKVNGIPAKFVIDGNGNIRFDVSGFKGKAEAAAEELVQMVEIARKGA